MTEAPYNPLEKSNLARSIETELLIREPTPLAAVNHIVGAGIYVIYYVGPFRAYEGTRAILPLDAISRPIYVGKAIPKGGRKGGLTKDSSKGYALADRLRQHAASVSQAGNLNLEDFWVRYLVVEDIWIPLGENMLIERFKPVWNRAVDGFWQQGSWSSSRHPVSIPMGCSAPWAQLRREARRWPIDRGVSS